MAPVDDLDLRLDLGRLLPSGLPGLEDLGDWDLGRLRLPRLLRPGMQAQSGFYPGGGTPVPVEEDKKEWWRIFEEDNKSAWANLWLLETGLGLGLRYTSYRIDDSLGPVDKIPGEREAQGATKFNRWATSIFASVAYQHAATQLPRTTGNLTDLGAIAAGGITAIASSSARTDGLYLMTDGAVSLTKRKLDANDIVSAPWFEGGQVVVGVVGGVIATFACSSKAPDYEPAGGRGGRGPDWEPSGSDYYGDSRDHGRFTSANRCEDFQLFFWQQLAAGGANLAQRGAEWAWEAVVGP